jgi:hypothetical protein
VPVVESVARRNETVNRIGTAFNHKLLPENSIAREEATGNKNAALFPVRRFENSKGRET